MVRAPQSTVDVRIREPRAESRHFFGSRSRSKLELAGPARRTLPSKSLVCLQRVWFSPPEHLNWTEQLKLLTPGTPKTLALGMECSQQNIEAMAAMLGQTLNPDATARKAAEDFLAQNSGVPGFGLVLLQLLTMDSAPAHIRQAGAVTFKNYVKKGWQAPEDGDAPAGQLIPDGDRAQIKTNIVSLMLSVPTQVQKQLGEGLSLIASHDFPAKWQNLLPELIAQLGSGNPAAIDGVLQSVNSVCKRFRAAMKTDEAMEQFKYVLDTFQDAHLQIFTALVDQLPQKNAPGADAEGLKLTMSSIRVCLRIFLSLNSLDIPEFYEDHMDDWFGRFQGFLATDFACPAIAGDASDGRPSLVEQVQAAVCENLELYMQKYEEEFGKYLPTFVPLVWQLLVAKGSEARYDILVTTCIKFLTSVSMSVHHSVFENPATLEQICTHIVIPNIKFREEDEELFEDNPQEYIRQDIEGSDTDTRRRTACELVKGLRKYYEGPCTQIFGKHVTELLAQHAANPRANWQAKDAAVYIVTSLAVKTSTARDGTTSTNELVNIVDFFQTNILPELQSADAAHPILTADAIKFATTFRLQLPKASYGAIISALAPYLGNAACPAVTVSYIAHCLERLLTVRDQAPGGSKVGRVTKEEMAPALESLLGGFFGALDRDDMKENEYVMKAVMRLISFGKELLLPHVSLCMEKLVTKLTAAAANPVNPSFNHYMFETIAALVKNVCAVHAEALPAFDSTLCPLVRQILDQDVQEFAPYVFQLLSMLLELHRKAGGAVPQSHMEMLSPLLMPVFWERPGYVPALAPLIVSYLRGAAAHIVSNSQVQPILGVFQKLISSKANDQHGFALLTGIVRGIPLEAVTPYLGTIFQLLFQRLSSLKTHKFVRGFVVFMSTFVCIHGAAQLLEVLNTVQPNIVVMLLDQVWLPGLSGLHAAPERKIASVALTKLVCDCPAMRDPAHLAVWNKALSHVVPLLEATGVEAVEDDDNFGLEEMSGHTAYSRLLNAGVVADPVCAEVADARQFFATSLQTLSQASPGQLRNQLGAALDAEQLKHIEGYMAKFGVAVV